MSPTAEVPSDESSASEGEGANLSEYEEEVRRKRGMNPSATSAPISIGHHRYKSSSSLAASPKATSPYMLEADYGIELVDQEGHKAKDFLMTKDLISKVSHHLID